MGLFEQRYRDDLEDILTAWVGWARNTRGTLRILAPLHPMSPFLTLAEWAESAAPPEGEPEGLPSHVVKLLVVLPGDPSAAFWRGVLERESERWRRELDERLRRPNRVATLGLPLAGPSGDLVRTGEIGPLRRSELLAGGAGGEKDEPFPLPFLARPYVAWPRLAEIGLSGGQLRGHWDHFCAENGVESRLREPLFPHFCDEALVNGRDLLMASAWRFDVFR